MNKRIFPARGIAERIFIQGELTFVRPVRLGAPGSGLVDDDDILRDSASGHPMISGATLAGALRGYLRDFTQGYLETEDRENPRQAQRLFGFISEEAGQDASVMSWLLVDDAVCAEEPEKVTRDGVAIDGETRSARKGAKFDHDMLREGARFPISLELHVPAGEIADTLVESLAVALRGLQQGEIALGFRKHRGSGECLAHGWRVRRYDMHDKKDVAEWILGGTAGEKAGDDIWPLLMNGRAAGLTDRRREFRLTAWLEISDTFLIRDAGSGAADPDHVPLADQDGTPFLSGWSLAGALRHRALKILNTLEMPQPEDKLDALFGPGLSNGRQKPPRGSKLRVRETRLTGHSFTGDPLVQTRIQVDRFTGGAMRQHLFSEIPLTKGGLEVDLRLINPQPAEIGLLLLLLKDLWTEDLPLGGEASIGRGRLKGKRAELSHAGKRWVLVEDGAKLSFEAGDPQELQVFVDAIGKWEVENHG